ncbi:hypothetical protein [Saccharopolyspora sp. NPDC002376]
MTIPMITVTVRITASRDAVTRHHRPGNTHKSKEGQRAAIHDEAHAEWLPNQPIQTE